MGGRSNICRSSYLTHTGAVLSTEKITVFSVIPALAICDQGFQLQFFAEFLIPDSLISRSLLA